LKEPLVSIIVPVYNAGEHLFACLESIRRQSWPRLEVLLINDGSTDGSLAVCESFEAEDTRFKVIDQMNAGVSAARNRGLKAAKGEYIQFVDADDRLAPDATEILVRAGEKQGADLVVAHFYRVVEDRVAQRGHIKKELYMNRADYAEWMRKAPAKYYYGVLWNKFYRRSILERHEIKFDPNLSWCEDFIFNLEYLRYCRLVAAIPRPVYYYYKREGSLVTSNISLRRTIQMKKTTFAYYKDLYQSLDLYEQRRLSIYGYLIASATDGTAISLPEPLAAMAKEQQMQRERAREFWKHRKKEDKNHERI